MSRTPGPWNVFSKRGVIEIHTEPGETVVGWLGFDSCYHKRDNEDNARLMAAAPEMENALHLIRLAVECFEGEATLRQIDALCKQALSKVSPISTGKTGAT
jgi:hypothetical protein